MTGLILYIRNFESQLDGDQEIAMGFAGSDAGVLKIEGLGFFEPDLITFYGRDEDGMKTQLIQHVAQLSMMLRAVPKTAPEAPPRRIGFHLSSGWIGGESGDGFGSRALSPRDQIWMTHLAGCLTAAQQVQPVGIVRQTAARG